VTSLTPRDQIGGAADEEDGAAAGLTAKEEGFDGSVGRGGAGRVDRQQVLGLADDVERVKVVAKVEVEGCGDCRGEKGVVGVEEEAVVGGELGVAGCALVVAFAFAIGAGRDKRRYARDEVHAQTGREYRCWRR